METDAMSDKDDALVRVGDVVAAVKQYDSPELIIACIRKLAERQQSATNGNELHSAIMNLQVDGKNAGAISQYYHLGHRDARHAAAELAVGAFAELYADLDRLRRERDEAVAEATRLRSGQWKPEEIHDLCHNLHGTVDADGFAEGCRKEITKIYGRCPWDEKLAAAEARARAGEEALKFYANAENWNEQAPTGCHLDGITATQLDRGDRARAVIAPPAGTEAGKDPEKSG